MTKPKKFSKGSHVYTNWGKGVKEVKKMTEKTMPAGQEKLKINIDENTQKGVYANMASITHTPEEFIVDFILRAPGVEQAKVVSRVITSPSHAKRLYLALGENISRYENHNGIIKTPKKQIAPESLN